MASNKISTGTKKQKVENTKSSGPMLTGDEVPDKNMEYVHILFVLFFYSCFNVFCGFFM